jgi:hypothetical protein
MSQGRLYVGTVKLAKYFRDLSERNVPTPPVGCRRQGAGYRRAGSVMTSVGAPRVAALTRDQRGAGPVAAVSSWVGTRLWYVPGSSGPTDGAVHTLLRRQGVCRDYAHLVVALLRALGVPARVAAVYAPGLEPMDFRAVADLIGAGARSRCSSERALVGKWARSHRFSSPCREGCVPVRRAAHRDAIGSPTGGRATGDWRAGASSCAAAPSSCAICWPGRVCAVS